MDFLPPASLASASFEDFTPGVLCSPAMVRRFPEVISPYPAFTDTMIIYILTVSFLPMSPESLRQNHTDNSTATRLNACEKLYTIILKIEYCETFDVIR